MLHIYCDGSAMPNPGPSGYAFLALRGQTKFLEVYEYLGEGTNQIGEMLGLRQALRLAGKREATIYTDSEWALNICTSKWKASCYQQTWKEIKNMLLDCHKIVWVKAHDKNKYNEEVDRLAKIAVEGKVSTWTFKAQREKYEEEVQAHWRAHINKEVEMANLRRQRNEAKKGKGNQGSNSKKPAFKNNQGWKNKPIFKAKK